MTKILHIFKKDIRRHWPEILISLALLALYTRSELHFWQIWLQYDVISPSFPLVDVERFIPFFLVLSWAFLILRVVHGDTLVGDRQWWVSKPYIWWHLLLAKVFFIFVFVSVPLFPVQLLLLHHAGFSTFANIGRLLQMQFTLPLVIIALAFALASLTKNLAQALLGIGIVVVIFIADTWLNSIPSQMTGDSSRVMDTLESLLLLGPLILVPVWQFARRRTWTSRATIAACAGIAALLSLIPFGRSVEQSYPLLSLSDSPAQFSIPPIPKVPDNPHGLPSFMTDSLLTIPLNVTEVPPGSLVIINGFNLTVDSSDDGRWTRGWVGQYQQLWSGSQRQNLNYQVKRKGYEKVKAKLQNLHIQLALSEYQEADARTLVLPATGFRDNDLGICRLTRGGYQVECRRPFHSSAYMGRFDAPHSPCGPVQRFPNSLPPNLDVAYAWSRPTDEASIDPGLNPIVEYAVRFNPVSRIPDPRSTSPIEYSPVFLCSGAEIRLARPIFKRRFRIQLELPAVHLQDLVERNSFGGAGVSIDLRTPM